MVYEIALSVATTTGVIGLMLAFFATPSLLIALVGMVADRKMLEKYVA